jgi:hypothetical protein
MEKRVTCLKNFISSEECNSLLYDFKNELSTSNDFLAQKLKEHLNKMKYNGSGMSINDIKFYSISTENTEPVFLSQPGYDLTLLLVLNSDFKGGNFIFLNEETNKNLHMNNLPGDMITFFPNIKCGNNKILSGTKYYLKINVNNVLEPHTTKSII